MLYRKFKPTFFRPEQYRRMCELSIAFSFDENTVLLRLAWAAKRAEGRNLFQTAALARTQADRHVGLH